MRQESLLKGQLMQEFKISLPEFVAMRHEDIRTSGYPDLSLTGFGRDSWIEVKHGDPHFDSTGIQKLTMLRLARAGYARYLIYIEKDGQVKRTLIVHPKDLKSLQPEAFCIGFDHKWVADFFRRRHRP